MTVALDTPALDQLFLKARTHNGWTDQAVSDETLARLYELTRQAPTAFNACPARFVFVRSPEGKEKLKATLMPGNVDKTMQAPVVAIVAIDTQWFERLPELCPMDVVGMFRSNPELAQITGMRSGTLQGAYLIMAARALGLDCGPMSGFDAPALDKAFFPDGQWKSNFICAIGHGNPAALRPVGARLDFATACQLA